MTAGISAVGVSRAQICGRCPPGGAHKVGERGREGEEGGGGCRVCVSRAVLLGAGLCGGRETWRKKKAQSRSAAGVRRGSASRLISSFSGEAATATSLLGFLLRTKSEILRIRSRQQ